VAQEIPPEFVGAFLPASAGAPGALERRQGVGEDRPDVLRGLGQEEVQRHRKVVADAALDGLRFPEEQFPDVHDVHETARDGDEEADLVQAAPAGPTHHLVEFGARQRQEGASVEEIGIDEDDRPGREVDARGDRRGGEDRAEMAPVHHRLDEELPGRELPAVVRGDPSEAERPHLLVRLQVREALQELLPVALEGAVIGLLRGGAGPRRRVAVRPRLEKEDRREEIEGRERPENAGEMGRPAASASARRRKKSRDLAEELFLLQVRHEPPGGVQEEGIKGDRALFLLDDDALLAAQPREPVGDLLAVADRRGEHQQVDAGGEVDHGLFPDDPAVAVAQVVGLVEDDEVEGEVAALVHGVVELVAQDFRGAHDHGGVGVLLRVAREDAHVHALEPVAELHPLGVRQGLQGRGVPAPFPLAEHVLDGLLGDPGLAGSRRGHDEAVRAADGLEGLELKGVRPEGGLVGLSDPGEHIVEDGLGLERVPRRAFAARFSAPAPSRAGAAGAASMHGGDAILGVPVSMPACSTIRRLRKGTGRNFQLTAPPIVGHDNRRSARRARANRLGSIVHPSTIIRIACPRRKP